MQNDYCKNKYLRGALGIDAPKRYFYIESNIRSSANKNHDTLIMKVIKFLIMF